MHADLFHALRNAFQQCGFRRQALLIQIIRQRIRKPQVSMQHGLQYCGEDTVHGAVHGKRKELDFVFDLCGIQLGKQSGRLDPGFPVVLPAAPHDEAPLIVSALSCFSYHIGELFHEPFRMFGVGGSRCIAYGFRTANSKGRGSRYDVPAVFQAIIQCGESAHGRSGHDDA